jgi:hypothetical protein
MTTLALWVVGLSLALLLYTYTGYPLLPRSKDVSVTKEPGIGTSPEPTTVPEIMAVVPVCALRGGTKRLPQATTARRDKSPWMRHKGLIR